MPRVRPTRFRALRAFALRFALLLTLGAAVSLGLAVALRLHPTYFHNGMEARDFGAWRDDITQTWYIATRWLSGPGRVEWQISRITPSRIDTTSIFRVLLDPDDGRKKEFPTRRIVTSPAPIYELPTPDAWWRMRSIYGLPFHCLSCAEDTPTDGGLDGVKRFDAWYLPISLGFRKYQIIPTRIHWLPLAANATIFAAALYALFLLPFHLRRALRKRRKHCPHCNYDLRATPPSQPCPECGQAHRL